MSTVEIADMTGKEHFNVMRDARKMLADLRRDALSFEGIAKDSRSRSQTCLNLPKEECLTLVTGAQPSRWRRPIPASRTRNARFWQKGARPYHNLCVPSIAITPLKTTTYKIVG
jgi:hypothetical protein